ncbi:MAG TPA: hypothetical protein VMC08_02900 [Bacteroidales bacterium]|nr:hypothetical protein [Bacteroidales bacterium]
MIRYLPHKDIDKNAWDTCLRRSFNGIVYAQSWFLDIVSPGWDALVGGEYESVFPLTHHRKFGIPYLYQPFFTQQLGIFSGRHLTAQVVQEFIDAIPRRFRLADIHLNAFNKVDPAGVPGKMRINLELDLIAPYEQLVKSYSENTRRNVKKAAVKGVQLIRKPDPDELITLFRENFGSTEKKLKYRHYDMLRSIMKQALANNLGMTFGAGLAGRPMSAGAFFLFDRTRRIFHFAATGPEGRDSGAMFLMIDSFIRENAGQALILDFEGSDDENVARFYKGFGGREVPYYMVRINRLPRILKLGLSLFRKT